MDAIILKISGEAMGGEKHQGLDSEKIKNIAEEIKAAHEIEKNSIGIVVGGGNFFRGRDAEGLNLDRIEVDYMGMLGTVYNAIALKSALDAIDAKAEILSCLDIPQLLELYSKDDANKYLAEGKIVIFAGGTGRPFFSTDTASVLRAIDINAKLILMAKNGVDGVYDKDPNTFKDAKKYDIITHSDVLAQKLGVMDETAAVLSEQNNINIFVFDINKKGNIKKAILNECDGTLIKKEL